LEKWQKVLSSFHLKSGNNELETKELKQAQRFNWQQYAYNSLTKDFIN
jgi:hypothetical protein